MKNFPDTEKRINTTVFFYCTLFLICVYYIAGLVNVVWFPGEDPMTLRILGGASAIFYIFFAQSYEERSLSLLSFFLSNLTVFYVLQMPDLCCFVVGLSIIFLANFHLYLFLGSDVLFHFIFFAVLLSRIFFNHQMGQWGFGLVTELLLLRLYCLFFEFILKKEDRSEEGSRIEPLFYFIALFGIAFLNLLYLDYGLIEILIHMNFLFAGAALIFVFFFSQTITELIMGFLLYIISNCSIGFFLASSVMTFFQITSVFLLSNGIFASFLFLKAQRENQSLSDILFANKREGIQTQLVVYFLLLGVLLTKLNPEFNANSLYSNWLVGLGIQIGFLTALNYFFKK